MSRSWVPVVASGLLAFPAFAQQATITDGDTFKLAGTTSRLHGIDAPEMKQWCGDYAAGVIAAGALVKLIQGGKAVACEHRDTDRYGRTVAICRIDGRDLGETMVRLGMAWAFVPYSRDYVVDEENERAERLAVHGHDCAPAWQWRARI